MFKADIVSHMEACGAMTIVHTEGIERGEEIARGCLQGGVNVMETNYMLPNVGDVITTLNHEFEKTMLVGAGIMLDTETCRMATLTGAKFVIASNFSGEVACTYNRYQTPYAPGCTTITEMLEASEVGTFYIKTFPISNFYGPQLVRIVQASIPGTPLMASDGASLDNLEGWLENGISCVGFGGSLTNGIQTEVTDNVAEIRRIIDIHRK